MKIRSTPTTIAINAPGTSALGMLAASMPVGTWAELATNDISAALLSATNAGGVGGNNIPYSNQMAWNRVTRQIQFVCSDHGAAYMPEITYDEATNKWSVTTATGISTGTHAYGHFQVRPDNGDRYTRHNGGGVAPEPAYRKRIGEGAWSQFTASPNTYTQIGVGSAWWPGSNTGATALSGMGAAGCYIIFEISLGSAMAYDPIADAWTALSVPAVYPAGGDPYHTVAAYSRTFNCVVFGGGNGNRKLWRLNQDRSVTPLVDCPMNIGVQGANLAADPVSGKFLVWGGGSDARKFLELDPTGGGTFTTLGGTRQPPPAGTHGVSDPSGGSGGPDALVSCALPDHGVIAYVSASGASYANVFLYKHA